MTAPRITPDQVRAALPDGYRFAPIGIDRKAKTMSPLAAVMLADYPERVEATKREREATMKQGEKNTEAGAIVNAAVDVYGFEYFGGFLCGLAGEPDTAMGGRCGDGWTDGAKCKGVL